MTQGKMPKWVQRELDDPAAEGGRNQQMIKVGPTLIRAGWDVDALVSLFSGIFPDLAESEIAKTCQSAARYAEAEGFTKLSKSAYIAKRRLLHGIEEREAQKLPAILQDYDWRWDDICAAGNGISETEGILQRRIFLETMFDPLDVLWVGEVHQSGEKEVRGRIRSFKHLFKTRDEWLAQPRIRGEFTSHCTFKPGTVSRAAENVAHRRYFVVESDALSLDEVGSVFNYLATERNFVLRAIVFSGKRSLHGWFEYDETLMCFDTLCATLRGLKCDPATPRPSQPVRLPGCIRRDTKLQQTLLLLTAS